ncbi:hypothetical protein [Eisenibacter elegans]|uniref:hypothetical protein n=1 Tax=Eisenibacter elegans TaxID=997 RepID=UPI000415A6D0|nr:hypothetical protein [Eisenibacter elegans]
MKRQLLYESLVVKYYYEDDNRLLYCHWLAFEDINDEELRTAVEKLCELILSYRPQSVLDNSLAVDYAILPETQEWIAQKLDDAMHKGLATHYALVMSNDFFAELSNAQILEEVHQARNPGEHSWVQASFQTEDEAHAWLPPTNA